MTDPSKSSACQVVTIAYEDLLQSYQHKHDHDNDPAHEYKSSSTTSTSTSLMQQIGQAFGNSNTSLGILCVSGIPQFQTIKQNALQLTHQLATEAPPHVLQALEHEASFYSVGWSHGKEKVEGDKFDTGKGSFYFNPVTDHPLQDTLNRDFGSEDEEEDHDNEDDSAKKKKKELFLQHAAQNGAFYASNIWPDGDPTQIEQGQTQTQTNAFLPELKPHAMELGSLIRSVGLMIARQCDRYVRNQCPAYNPGTIENVIQHSLCCKARLLHYFPVDAEPEPETQPQTQKENDANKNNETSDASNKSHSKDVDYSNWCGWHNDHCSLTGLVPAIYINAEGEEVQCPDPSAGLYIKARNGTLVHVQIPSDCLAFQIGETSQIHTGGILQATPHAVRGCDPSIEGCQGLSRNTCAVFMEPEYFGHMNVPQGKTMEDVQKPETETHFPPNVRLLKTRWKAGMNFGEFSEATFAAFY